MNKHWNRRPATHPQQIEVAESGHYCNCIRSPRRLLHVYTVAAVPITTATSAHVYTSIYYDPYLCPVLATCIMPHQHCSLCSNIAWIYFGCFILLSMPHMQRKWKTVRNRVICYRAGDAHHVRQLTLVFSPSSDLPNHSTTKRHFHTNPTE